MPIGNGGGRRGSSGILAMPNRRHGAPRPSAISPQNITVRPFRSPPFSDYISARISGQTLDSAGSPIGDCVVELFLTSNDQKIANTVSDGSGNYSFIPTQYGPYYIVAYKAGSPDVAGTTVNTIVGS